MIETEIRFAVPDGMDSSVTQHYFAAIPGPGEYNRTTYFDTSDNALWNNGIEFRVRTNGMKHKQTVKTRIAGTSSFMRNEFEKEIESEQPDLTHLHSVLPPELRSAVYPAQFRPAFRTEIRRRKRIVEKDGNTIEAVHDRGWIVAGRTSTEIDEVEHELQQGGSQWLTDACLSFLDAVPCGLQTEGKAARGFRLATGANPVPAMAENVFVPSTAPLPEAIVAMMRAAYAQVLANQSALLLTGDIEAVHQMRVGLRRLRSVLSAFAPVLDLSGAPDLLSETKALFARLGDVREADVFVSETIAAIPETALDARRRQILDREVHRYRDRAYADVANYVNGPRFGRFAVRLNGWIESGNWLRNAAPVDRLLRTRPVADFAASRLSEMERKLIKRGRRALKGTIDDWHEARIAAKKVRYAGEPLAMVMSPVSAGRGKPKFTKGLARLQDELGVFNDFSNVPAFLARVRETVPKNALGGFGEAAAFCAGWSTAEVGHAVHRLEKSWKKFEDEKGVLQS